MLVDFHVLYAKKIDIDDERIRRALLQPLETNDSKFTNRRDLLNAILDQSKDLTEESRKYVKRKREQRNALCMPCGHLLLCWPVYLTQNIVFTASKGEQKNFECTVVT